MLPRIPRPTLALAACALASCTLDDRSLAPTGLAPAVATLSRAPGHGASLANPPALPRATVSTAMPAVRRTIHVHRGDNLQQAIDAAQRGDELVLDAGATWRGSFFLRAKPGSAAHGWITLRSSAATRLPTGVRVSPVDAPKMARLMSVRYSAALQTASGASGYRLIGLELTQDSAYTTWANPGILLLGDGSSAQSSLAQVPRDLVVDRVWVHGLLTGGPIGTKRCIALNSAATAIIDSYLSDCAMKGQDSQAIIGWNGPGPFLIQNNRLEGGAENVLFGGADPAIPNLIPSDITIRGNYLHRPRSWQGRYTVKNLFELKNAQRVLVEGNVMRNHWVDAQSGFAVVMGSVNQSGACGWCVVQDVAFRYNQLDSAAAGFNLYEGYAGASWTRRAAFTDNLLTNVGARGLGSNGRLYQISGHLDDLALENNTGFAPYSFLLFSDGHPVPKARFSFRNNVGGDALYNLQSAVAVGAAMFHANLGSSWVAAGNVIVGAVRGGVPTGNANPASMAALMLVNPAPRHGNWAFQTRSPFRRSGVNGTTPGADLATLLQLTAGVDR